MMHLIVLTVLSSVTAAMSSDEFKQTHTVQAPSVDLTVSNVGLLLCKGKCLRIEGCESIKFHKDQLRCQLLPHKTNSTNLLTKITRCNKHICNETDSPLSTLIINNRRQRQICVSTVTKQRIRISRDEDEDVTPQYLVASSIHSFTYYGCYPSGLHKIERQKDGSYKLGNIPVITFCGSKKNPNKKLRGMATGPCLFDERTFCLYHLLDRTIGRHGKFLRNLTLVYHEESSIHNNDEYVKMEPRSTSLGCIMHTADSRSHFNGVAFDSKLSMYVFHYNILIKFGRSGENFSMCTFVRRIHDAAIMESMAVYTGDRDLFFVSSSWIKIYDLSKMNSAGRKLAIFARTKRAFYCVDTREKKAVVVSAADLSVVTLYNY